MKTLTNKQFNAKLAQVCINANGVRVTVQELIEDALHTATQDPFDTTKLIDLVRKLRNGTGSGTGLDTTSIIKYIQLAAPTMQKGKTKDKATKFSWPTGSTAESRVLDLDFIARTKWWQKSKLEQDKQKSKLEQDKQKSKLEQDKQTAALDVNKRVANLCKAVEAADELGTVEANTIAQVELLLEKLKASVAA